MARAYGVDKFQVFKNNNISDCGLNIHRPCVHVLEENCPGPMVKKERGDRISKLMEKIRPETARRKPSSLNLNQGIYASSFLRCDLRENL